MVCLLLFVLAVGPAFAQRFPIRHLGGIGHLEGKPPVSLGNIRAASVRDNYARLDGRDKEGKPWRAWMRTFGGIAGTEVWTADFDRNGQQDLLIARHFAANGWCPTPVDVVVLLFDTQGRRVPWKIHSQMPPSNANERYPFEPIAILDTDRDGRAEFVATGCASPFEKHPLGGGWIEAVYSAKDARLTIVKSPNLKSYRTRVGALNARPAEWKDRRGDLEAKPWERIESIATGEFGDDPSGPPLPSREETEVVITGGPKRAWPDASSSTDPKAARSGSKTRRRVARTGCDTSCATAIRCDGLTMVSCGPMAPDLIHPN